MKFLMLFVLSANISVAQEPPTETAEQAQQLKQEMDVLLVFLKDQEDHKTICPDIEWEQPDISVYKEEKKSQLPPECQ
tara:strand:+ start:617 stop:850 length:234 start_codon:yes stop_codon:yes gene_type:complete